jgi:hypothetical protein
MKESSTPAISRLPLLHPSGNYTDYAAFVLDAAYAIVAISIKVSAFPGRR